MASKWIRSLETHVEYTIPLIVMFLALPIAYYWLKPWLAFVALVCALVGLLFAIGAASAKKRSSMLEMLKYAQPERVDASSISAAVIQYLLFRGLAICLAVFAFVCLILYELPGV